MEIVIREVDLEYGRLDELDDRFLVESVMVLSMKDNQIHYTVQDVPAYEKSYTDSSLQEQMDESSDKLVGEAAPTIYAAFAGEQAVGRIVLTRHWNHFAYIEDIAVDKRFRRHGIGRRLIYQAAQWAEKHGLAGLTLETQTNNVPACKFYERCGFVIGGFDAYLYRGIPQHRDEVAVYWYKMLQSGR
ncbi:GNAT family N-acetyltransferase [Paenibacillus sp. GCM10027626]|uniref:GNAT family N-acetyltransferase n=1 Tax=Paenibacillus sp. GCM10027626 TaxID=3273411 RepID=UPI00363F6148